MAATVNLEDAVQGCLLGTAFGDALGLAYEGMSRKRIARRFKMPLRYHLLPGNRGMVSDDTEQKIVDLLEANDYFGLTKAQASSLYSLASPDASPAFLGLL